jgi:hypothetical protein
MEKGVMFKLLPLVIRYLRYYITYGVWKNTLEEGGKRLLKNLKKPIG